MKSHDVIKQTIDQAHNCASGYLKDLTDEEMLKRPCPGCNHINWQVGHLIWAEHFIVDKAVPGTMPALPDGFAEQYSKETAGSDDGSKFRKKDELLKVLEEQRAGTLAALAKTSEEQFDGPSGFDFLPNLGAVFTFQPTHWLMHAGQWAVVRRQLGRKPLF